MVKPINKMHKITSDFYDVGQNFDEDFLVPRDPPGVPGAWISAGCTVRSMPKVILGSLESIWRPYTSGVPGKRTLVILDVCSSVHHQSRNVRSTTNTYCDWPVLTTTTPDGVIWVIWSFRLHTNRFLTTEGMLVALTTSGGEKTHGKITTNL